MGTKLRLSHKPRIEATFNEVRSEFKISCLGSRLRVAMPNLTLHDDRTVLMMLAFRL